MNDHVSFDREMIERYDVAGPRYTSYPTALQFDESFGNDKYLYWIDRTNEDPIPTPLSIYLHIPFCNTICYYCGCSKVVTRNKSKAAEYISLLKKEIGMQGKLFAKDRQVTQIHWGGGTPTFLDDREIYELISCLHDNFSITDADNLESGIEVDPRTVDEDRIKNLANLGFNRISFGVQDFDKKVQAAVNREQDTQSISRLISAARDNNFKSINIDLMYGLPKQGIDSFRKTLEKTIELNPDRIAIYNYAHMPERFKPQRRINEQDLPSPEDKLSILQMSIEMMQKAGYHYIGMDHFARENDSLVKAQKQGTLQRNFQGYSTSAECDIVAMGVTAISRIGDSFSQNVRTIDEYRERMNANQLAVHRGIELEADDVLRGEIISELMCNNKLDIHDVERRWSIDFRTYFKPALQKLKAMADDGLVRLDDDNIAITNSGRLLARVICMQFDKYLPVSGTISKIKNFSRVI